MKALDIPRSAIIDSIEYKHALMHRCRPFWRTLGALIIDSLVGVFMAWLFWKWDLVYQLLPLLHLSIQQIDWVIDWLTKYPAGLKLNDQLNELLAGFFRYHIQLWRIYVTALDGRWIGILLLSSTLLGVSHLFAAISDILRLLTLHIYCFHLYALR